MGLREHSAGALLAEDSQILKRLEKIFSNRFQGKTIPHPVQNIQGPGFNQAQDQANLADGDWSDFKRFGDFAVAEPFFEKVNHRQSFSEHQPLFIGQEVFEEIFRYRLRL